jgi:uncharacterized protein with ATP-grasp and redox domains
MKAFLDCLACTVNQGLRTARYSSDDPAVQERVLRAMLAELAEADFTLTPVELGNLAQCIAARETSVFDPYRAARRCANEEALQLYPRLKAIVRAAPQPLLTAAKIAIVGNIIDLGAYGEHYDVEGALARLLDLPFARNDFPRFEAALRGARRILYLADNAGEIVFDRVLMEELGPAEVTVAVKSEPFINDAQLADAQQVGLTERTRVIEIPVYPGTTHEFVAAWQSADVIISKGHANYESYDETPGPRFFLLLAKCDFVAQATGVTQGEMVLLAGE